MENLALRQQLAVWKARQPRPQLTAMDRMFWVMLSRLWKSRRNSLQMVRPETVVGWHRQGFRRYWAWKSQRRRSRPAIRTELRDLIRWISRANPLWGAPRIHGELLKLGLTVSQATVSKYMLGPRRPPSQAWRMFLGPGPTYRWPRTHPSHGVCSRRARAVWWRCPAWVGSITNTSGERREPMGRISGSHSMPAPLSAGM